MSYNEGHCGFGEGHDDTDNLVWSGCDGCEGWRRFGAF